MVAGTLLDVLERTARRAGAARGVLVRLVDAVAGMHGCGVLYRDLKPENVLLATDSIKLCDLGDAAWIDNGAAGRLRTSRPLMPRPSCWCARRHLTPSFGRSAHRL